MGMKRRVKRYFDPWGKMKPEDYSCSVPWDTEWKHYVEGCEILPMPGVIRFDRDESDGRRSFRLVGYYDGCGHWTEDPLGGELAGVYGGRLSAVGGLICAARGACWDCLLKAWKPLFRAMDKRKKTDAQETNR